MKSITKLQLLVMALFVIACGETKESDQSTIKKNLGSAPVAEKKDSVLSIHGHDRVDSYFWMRLTDDQKRNETPDAQTAKVISWLEAENEYTKTALKGTEALQEKLYQEIVGRIKQTDESVPYFKNGYWYYTRYEEGKNYPIHCRKKESMDAEEQVMLDVNKLAANSSYYRAGGLSVSPDNKLLAFGEDTLSRNIFTIRFLNLETGEYLPDQITNTTASGAWANDSKTYFYTTKNKVSLLSEKIWRHTLGKNTSQDVMVYHEKDPSYYIGVYKSKSEDYVIIYTSSTLNSGYRILDANTPNGEFKEFSPREDTAHEYSIDEYNDKFYIVTNWNAKNFRLMETHKSATSKENWKEVIPNRDDVMLNSVEVFDKHLVLRERSNASTQLRVMNQETKEEHYVDFGETAYVAYFSMNVEYKTDKLLYRYSSLTTPTSAIEYDMNTKEKKVLKQQEIVGGHNPEDYVTERIFALARDGAKIPISIVYKKGFNKDGKAPLWLYSYGSYGNSSDPWFSSTRLSLLDRGFAYAIAHIRGGQEMGRHWYDDGKMFNKKNTFNDFVDCSKYLIDQKYTSPKHLYASGGSAGGLLMGAIVNMNPELYNGVVAAVPFVDVVSTMLDESIPLTTNEFDEWGNPKNKDSYDYMLSYSPYDNVKAKAYPNMLVTTGFFDSQVQYWEPAKWVAKLREKKTDDNVLLLKTNMEAGHGGASGRYKRYKETATRFAFFLDLEGING